MQRKTQRPAQFEITEPAREAVAAWVARADLHGSEYLFPGHEGDSHLSVRQVCTPGQLLGFLRWPRSGSLRHALAAAYESDAHLQANRVPQKVVNPARAYAARDPQRRRTAASVVAR